MANVRVGQTSALILVLALAALFGFGCLARRAPALLHGCIAWAVAALLLLVLIQIVLGHYSAEWARDGHGVLARVYSRFFWITYFASVAACVGYSIRTRSFFGFRKLPSGTLCLVLSWLVFFSGYLKPPDPEENRPALLRFFVLHRIVLPILLTAFLIRWLVLVRRVIRTAPAPSPERAAPDGPQVGRSRFGAE